MNVKFDFRKGKESVPVVIDLRGRSKFRPVPLISINCSGTMSQLHYIVSSSGVCKHDVDCIYILFTPTPINSKFTDMYK